MNLRYFSSDNIHSRRLRDVFSLRSGVRFIYPAVRNCGGERNPTLGLDLALTVAQALKLPSGGFRAFFRARDLDAAMGVCSYRTRCCSFDRDTMECKVKMAALC